MDKHIGKQSIRFQNPPVIVSVSSVAGPKEGEGPLGSRMDRVSQDILLGKETWEKAESEYVRQGIELAVEKSGLPLSGIQYILAGDLLNQAIGTSFGVRSLQRPFLGLFGACSTIGEAMMLGAALVDGGFADYVAASASSHFCSAEKTFRFPLELGSQRPPTASWTVTGGGAMIIGAPEAEPGRYGACEECPRVTAATTGKIVDMGIKDANNMGAAMAPAAADVLTRHFEDLNIRPEEYDVIATGDLGHFGREILFRLMLEAGYDISGNTTDCGIEIFDRDQQDTHAGGSGCACAAVTFAAYFYPQLCSKRIKKFLLVPTGALMNSTTVQQGESIPAIAHAVRIEAGGV
ncbi:MAG: stage V sporulation protein AD [Clostridiales bacterium]|jgi:stage V sporulation protein AD|nr:stage V sporulation protein AD [Clostridiales bacterium]